MRIKGEKNMNKLLTETILNYIKVKKVVLKTSTIARYFNLYENHIKDYFEQTTINQVTNKLLQEYVDNQINKGITSIVVREAILLIKLSLKREAKFGEIKMPYLDLDIPENKKVKRVETLSQIEEKIIINHIFNNDRKKYSGVILSLFTGMRIGEICALKWADIDLKKRQIIVNKTLQRICVKNQKSIIEIGHTKTISANRTIPISNLLYDFLMAIKPANRNYYFLTNNIKPNEPRNYRKIYKTMLKKLNIKSTTFHALRHTFATRLIENKIDIKTISELLGHASTNITISIYVHSEYNTKKKAIKTLDKLFLK